MNAQSDQNTSKVYAHKSQMLIQIAALITQHQFKKKKIKITTADGIGIACSP